MLRGEERSPSRGWIPQGGSRAADAGAGRAGKQKVPIHQPPTHTEQPHRVPLPVLLGTAFPAGRAQDHIWKPPQMPGGQSVAEKPRAAERKETGCSNGEHRSPEDKQSGRTRLSGAVDPTPRVWNPLSALAGPQEIWDRRHRGHVWPGAQLLPSPGPTLRQGNKLLLLPGGPQQLPPPPHFWPQSQTAGLRGDQPEKQAEGRLPDLWFPEGSFGDARPTADPQDGWSGALLSQRHLAR